MNDKEFIDGAVNALKDNKETYDLIKEEVVTYLKDLLMEKIPGISVSGRVKDASKIREKIYRKNYLKKYSDYKAFIKDLPDGIGVRIVCLLIDEELAIYEALKENLTNEELIDSKKYNYGENEKLLINLNGQPETQKNDLDIYRMDALYRQETGFIRVEIQIKSLTHYFWGELEHSLFYKNYNYTLSNDFYAGLMKNINFELENIDSEMCMLRNHMLKTPENQIAELHQIGALMISKKYSFEIEKIIECKIDLRETYALLVDMHFGLITDTEVSLSRLNELIEKLEKSKPIYSRYEKLEEESYDVKLVPESYRNIAELLHKNIKQGDIFWKFLYLIYEGIYSEEDEKYSEVLSKMAKHIKKLYGDIPEAADGLVDYDIQSIINSVIGDVACEINKISFFVLNLGMNNTKRILKNKIKEIQMAIIPDGHEVDASLFEANKNTIYYVLYITIMDGLNEKIKKERWDNILAVIKDKNDYQLSLEDQVLERIRKSGQLDKEDFIAFESVLKREEE